MDYVVCPPDISQWFDDLKQEPHVSKCLDTTLHQMLMTLIFCVLPLAIPVHCLETF
jgi:hypothetical protein